MQIINMSLVLDICTDGQHATLTAWLITVTQLLAEITLLMDIQTAIKVDFNHVAVTWDIQLPIRPAG